MKKWLDEDGVANFKYQNSLVKVTSTDFYGEYLAHFNFNSPVGSSEFVISLEYKDGLVTIPILNDSAYNIDVPVKELTKFLQVINDYITCLEDDSKELDLSKL